MVDISQFSSVVALAVLVGIFVQFGKAKIKVAAVPYFAVGVGVVLALLFGTLQAAIKAPADVASYALGGFFAGLLAIGGYEASIDKLKVR